MLSHRTFFIGLLLFPAVPALAQTGRLSHLRAPSHASRGSVPVASQQVRALVLPIDGLDTDSAQAIITRDLSFGDRVQVVAPDRPQTATAVVKAVATPQGVNVSLIDPVSGAIRQQGDFALPMVPQQNDLAIADSLNKAFADRDLTRRARIVRAETVRDSLQAEIARKPPRLRNKKAKQEYAALVAQRDTLLRQALAEAVLIQAERERDEASRATVQAAAIAHAALVRDSMVQVRRWALHGVSDAVEQWMTGQRGIAQSRIAYVSRGDIRVVDFDGANDHAVTHVSRPGVEAMSPAWRRDGKAIVFSEMSDAGTQIAVVDLASGKVTELAATPRGLNITPVFSTDDKWVIYANGTDSRTSLVAVRPDSLASLKRLPVNHSFDADEPILSPDGTRIAYVSSRPKTPQIYSSRLDGTDERVEAPAVPGKRVYHTSPDWSPDGRMIAYQQQNGDFQVWVVNRADEHVRKLTSRGENEDPSWAPDARHIALTSNRGGAKAIWVVDAQSGKFRQLTPGGDARLAAWSGDLGSAPSAPLAMAR